jgi:hypothetical protein
LAASLVADGVLLQGTCSAGGGVSAGISPSSPARTGRGLAIPVPDGAWRVVNGTRLRPLLDLVGAHDNLASFREFFPR